MDIVNVKNRESIKNVVYNYERCLVKCLKDITFSENNLLQIVSGKQNRVLLGVVEDCPPKYVYGRGSDRETLYWNDLDLKGKQILYLQTGVDVRFRLEDSEDEYDIIRVCEILGEYEKN